MPISGEFNSALRQVAEKLCSQNTNGAKISLSPFLRELSFAADSSSIVQALNEHVSNSNKNLSVELSNYKWALHPVMGHAIYFYLINKGSGQKILYSLCIMYGLTQMQPASEDEYLKACSEEIMQNRRTRQQTLGARDLQGLCALFRNKLAGLIHSPLVTSEQRTDALSHFEKFMSEGAGKDMSPWDIHAFSSTCHALGISLMDLLADSTTHITFPEPSLSNQPNSN